MKNMIRGALSAITVLAFATCANVATAQSLKIETGNSAGLTTLIPQMLAKSLAEQDIDLQINSDQTLTRSALSLGSGRIDAAIVPPPAFNAMKRAVGPYEKAGDQAKEAAAQLRALFPFAGGVFQPIVWADSGIEDWEDMRGKRIYIGPPAGAANRQITGLIKLASGGLEPEKDYEPVRLGWGAGTQAFQDDQFDVLVTTGPIGAASIEQIGLQKKFRMIPVPEEVVNSDAWKEYLEAQGESNATIAPGTYSGQVNSDIAIRAAAYAMVFAVNKSMDDDLAYKMTRTYWDNVEGYKKSVAILAQFPTDDMLGGNNVPLHPGALRYYKEKGIEVPASMIAAE